MPCGPSTPSMFSVTVGGKDLCLSTIGANVGQPGSAAVAECSGASDQLWTFDGQLLQQSQAGLCLQAPGGVATAGSELVTGPCAPVTAGLDVSWSNAGELSIGGLCLTSDPAAGTVSLESCGNTAEQLFSSICTVSPPPPNAPVPVPAPAPDLSNVPAAPLPAPAPAPQPTPQQASLSPATDANGQPWHPKYMVNRCGKNRGAMFVTTTTRGRLCLDTASSAASSGVVLNGCNEGPSQQWMWQDGAPGHLRLSLPSITHFRQSFASSDFSR